MEMIEKALRDRDPWALKVALHDYLPGEGGVGYEPPKLKEVEFYAGYPKSR